MDADDKITIIEGPPPVFESIHEGWPLGLHDTTFLSKIVMTRLRTFNGASLVERCHRAWRNLGAMHLHYRQSDGLEHQVPIVAARHVELPEGQLLLLWVRLLEEEMETQPDMDDDLGDDDLPGQP